MYMLVQIDVLLICEIFDGMGEMATLLGSIGTRMVAAAVLVVAAVAMVGELMACSFLAAVKCWE